MKEERISNRSVEYLNIDHQQISTQLNVLIMKNQQSF